MPTYINNRKAYYDYEILEKYEAGVKLFGHEVKAIKEGKGNLTGSYVIPKDNAFWLVGFNLPPYSKAGVLLNYDQTRNRKLLLHQKEIESLAGKVERQGYTLVPLNIHSKGTLLKVSIGLAKGKRKDQKKKDVAKRQQEKDMERALKNLL